MYISVGGLDKNLFYVMDTDLWWRFYVAGYKYIRIPGYVWAFRMHKDSKTSAHHFLTNENLDLRLKYMVDYKAETKHISDTYCNSDNGFNKIRVLILYLYHSLSVRFWIGIKDSILLKGKPIHILNSKRYKSDNEIGL